MKNKAIVIVPVYNESENIDFILDDLSRVKEYDVVFIDDASTDGSADMLAIKGQKVLRLPTNLGIGGCVQTGFKYAYEKGYQIAVQYDGDGQHCASGIGNLVAGIEKGFDYVIGSRFVNTGGFRSTSARRLGIKILSFAIKMVTKARINDVTSGFRACNRLVMGLFASYYPKDYPEPEVAGALAKNGYAILEIPAEMRYRQGGKSSINPIKSIYYMVKVTIAIIFTSFVYPKKGKDHDNDE